MARIPTTLKRDHNSAFVRYKGKRIYFGEWGSTKAQQDFADWLKTVAINPDVTAPKSKITISECVARYQLHANSYYPPQEARNVRAAMESLLKFAGEDRAVDFGPKLLKEFQRALAQKKHKDGTLVYARTTINSKIHKIRRCFRWCVSEELIPVEVLTALSTVPGIPRGRGLAREPVKVPPVPIEHVQATLPFLSPTVAAMVQVQYLCGMRPQDICGMTTGGIDQSKEIWIYRPEAHKNTHRGQSLTKAIPKAAEAILRPLLRDLPKDPIFSPLDSKQYFGNAPLNAKRGFYSTASYGKAIGTAIAKAGDSKPKVKIPAWRPNQLRHAIGTAIRELLGIEAAQDYLGHSKPDATLIYAERTAQALAETARGIVSPFSPVVRPHSQPE